MPGIGLDFGTTNSTLAVFDGERISYIDIDMLSSDPYIMPTALYLNREFAPAIGTEAIYQYLMENEGRQIRLSREDLGEIEVSYGELGMHQVAIHAYVDRDMPGQLFHGLKRWLGDPGLEFIKVFGSEYRSVALITPILEHIRSSAEEAIGKAIDAIHIGRPVHFEGGASEGNRIAMSRLQEAAANAGIPKASFYPEPLGATLGYIYGGNSHTGSIILTFDFGGGTLDLSLVKLNRSGFDILATHGLDIGGIKIDQEVFAAKVFPYLGKGTMVKTDPLSSAAELPFGFYRFSEDLLNWKNTHRLNTPENLRTIDYAIANCNMSAVRRFQRLKTLIQSNTAFTVHQSMEKAKIELSEKCLTLIESLDIDLNVPLKRAGFEDIILPVVAPLPDAVHQLLITGGIDPGDVDIVVRTGGSAQIPIVHKMLASIFPGKVVEYDVFKSIAAGLAIANYHGYQ